MSIEDDVRAVRVRLSQAQAKSARTQVEYDNAVQRRAQAQETLQTEFGVSSLDEARTVLQRLQEEYRGEIEKVTTALAESEA